MPANVPLIHPRSTTHRRHLTRGVTLGAALCVLSACSDKAKDDLNAISATGQIAAAVASGSMEKSVDEAAKFQADRRARGDTVAMPYAELQKLLPESIAGYSKAEEPAGSSQSMGAFSMSDAEQRYTAGPGADGIEPMIDVKIVDFGGTEGAYGMFALPMMMNIQREDAHSRMRTLTLGPKYTWASEDFNKDSKDARITAITRYRYAITVEANNQHDDQSEMIKKIVEQIVREFENK